MHRRATPNSGFTLIELLAVLALLGLVSGIGMRAFAASSERAAVTSLLDRVLSLDGMCRLWARQDGAVALVVEPTAGEVRVQRERDGVVLARERLRDPARVMLRSRSASAVRFSALGTSEDYSIDVSVGEISARASVLGLSGFTGKGSSP